MKNLIYRNDKKSLEDTHFFVYYRLRGNPEVSKAAWELAIGQSVGNPNVRNHWETDQLFNDHSCKIVDIPEQELRYNLHHNKYNTCIAFPYANLDWDTDGIAQLLCMIQGGQSDIDYVRESIIYKIEAPKFVLKPNKYGIKGFRDITNQRDKPFLGSIIKPKTGISKEILLDMVKQLVDGGVDFIKEDEILSNPSFCRIKDRVPYIMNYLQKVDSKVIYSVCINADPLHLMQRAIDVANMGGNSVHVNVWSGLGAYKSIRDLDLPLFLHYQRSGVKSMTEGPYGISWNVLCELAGMCGVDSIHAGMIGGYSTSDDTEACIKTLHKYNVVPSLSCGMHPGLISYVTNVVGNDYMASAGGSIHGHPGGTADGARAMRQAIDKTYGKEFGEAVSKWGIKTL